MGCSASVDRTAVQPVTGGSSPQAVAEAEEALINKIREENAELRRQNAQLTAQVQELQQRITALTTDVSALRTDMTASNQLANKALQAAQSAVERVESAQLPGAAGASQLARPPTAAGPIPIPASSSSSADSAALSQRVQQLESQLTALTSAWDRLEGQKAKEEFAKQLLAAKGEGLLTPGGGGGGSGHHHHQHSNSNGSAAAGPSGAAAAASPAARRSSNNGAGGSGSVAPPGEVIDGSGLLPANNNFPSRFGGGAAGLRAARDRTPGGRGGAAGESGDFSGPGGSGGFGGGGFGGGGAGLGLPGHAVSAGVAGGGGGGPPGGDLMSTHRYGTLMPSDFKLAEQRKAGPRQGFM